MVILVVISQWELGHQVNLISETEVHASYSSILVKLNFNKFPKTDPNHCFYPLEVINFLVHVEEIWRTLAPANATDSNIALWTALWLIPLMLSNISSYAHHPTPGKFKPPACKATFCIAICYCAWANILSCSDFACPLPTVA